jgi:DNA replication protein DnaC
VEVGVDMKEHSPEEIAREAWRMAHERKHEKKDKANGPDPDTTPSLETFCAADFDGKAVPQRQSLVEGIIPHRDVSLLSGDGGLGKTILALMLGTSLSTRTDWLGFKTMQGPCLYYGAEDELDELHRRLDQIRRELGV